MKRTFSSILIFLQILLFVNAHGFYSIVAPSTIQSQHNYSVSVTLHEYSEPSTIELRLLGPSLNKAKTLEILPSQTQSVNFELPKLESGSYQLLAVSVKGLIFCNHADLIFKNKEPKIYIQSDKATYKPGDLVQYRIIALDEETRPARLEHPLVLKFKDGAGNFVKQINDIKLTKGVYSGEFQLSEQPVLGSWMMKVQLGPNAEDTKTEKTFEVAKYVLPKFSVDIETAEDISYDSPLKITVRSKYTYGKPVRGKANIHVNTPYGAAQKEIDIVGNACVEFDLINDFGSYAQSTYNKFGYHPVQYDLYRSHGFGSKSDINVSVIVTEEYTGNKKEKQAMVRLHRSNYNIEIPNEIYEYSANKSFEYKAFVKNLDGSPVHNSKHIAQLIIRKRENEFVFTSELDKNGMALFKVTLPSIDHYSQVRVTYRNQIRDLPDLVRHLKRYDSIGTENDVGSLKLVKKKETFSLYEDVVVEVRSNRYIPYYVYNVVVRGDIIKQEYVKLPETVYSHEIKFKPSIKMVPEAHLYVYFVINGIFEFKEVTLNFHKEFQNKIEITAPEQAKPSEEVTLNIKTDPDSFVGLLAVDQSVLLLKSGNDLDSAQIINDLSSHSTTTPFVEGIRSYPGSYFGVVTLTNANYPYNSYHTHWNQFVMDGEPRRFISLKQTEANGVITHYSGILRSNIQPTIRKEFIESWIFDNINNTDANGLATLTKKIPDTITSWVVTGFSLNDKTGFGMVEKPTNIKVFQPFFISTNLPYSVKRGEVIAIPVIVFNYMDQALDTEVTMENTDDEYDFTEASNETDELVLKGNRIAKVNVPANSSKSLSFMIRPNKVGEVTLKIKAITPLAGDAILEKLKVEPEGVTHYENQALFITSSANKEPVKETLKAVIPQEAITDSEYLEFSVVGDILGPTIKNIHNLVRKPYGCGEQNMVNFVPNILVLQYLDAIKRKMPTVVEKAKKFMEVGYQRELTYKHENGAYSVFGEGRSEPSSWLTAYVARSYIQAKNYITIDQKVIDDALIYLISNQLDDGNFEQTGRLLHPSHQNSVGFTAFALLALMEDTDISKQYKKNIDKGIQYLTKNIDVEGDTYALAISLAVLRRAQHPSADKLMQKLEKLAHEENGLKWWTKTSGDTSNDIEITAYILQAYVASEPSGKLLPIIKWLIKNRNSMGGFVSTQDTVVGLQALIRFAEKYITAGQDNILIKFTAQDSEGKEATKGTFSLDNESSLTLQTHVFPKSSRQVTIEAEGEGLFLVQLSYRYNLATKDNNPSFSVKHTILKTPYPNLVKINVCANYLPGDNNGTKESNMAILEIYLPSGFTADTDKLDTLRQVKQVQRVEIKNKDTAIIVYFDYLVAGEDVCLEVNAEKTHAVAKQKPAAITIYDYYNSEQRATVYYEVKSSLCDICEGGECGKGCEKSETNKVE